MKLSIGIIEFYLHEEVNGHENEKLITTNRPWRDICMKPRGRIEFSIESGSGAPAWVWTGSTCVCVLGL